MSRTMTGISRVLRSKRFLLLIAGALVLVCGVCGVFFWAWNSQAVDDYLWLNSRGNERDIAVAFAVALRMNHPSAYDMIAPDLTPRLDEWMKTHRRPMCTKRSGDILSFGDPAIGVSVVYFCNTKNLKYTLGVDRIVVKDMKVIDWGEVDESYP